METTKEVRVRKVYTWRGVEYPRRYAQFLKRQELGQRKGNGHYHYTQHRDYKPLGMFGSMPSMAQIKKDSMTFWERAKSLFGRSSQKQLHA